MGNNLSEVMKKINNSRGVEEEEEKPVETPNLDEDVAQEIDEVDEDEEEVVEEKPVEEVKRPRGRPTTTAKVKEEKPVEQDLEGIRQQEIGALQNDGVFRVELLYQLNQLNQNIAEFVKFVKG